MYLHTHVVNACTERPSLVETDTFLYVSHSPKKKKKTLSSVLPNQMDSTSNIGHGEILKRVFYNGKWKFHSNTAVFQKVLSCTPRNEYITGTICPHPVKFLKPETKLCIGCRVDERILEHVLIHFPRRNISFFSFFSTAAAWIVLLVLTCQCRWLACWKCWSHYSPLLLRCLCFMEPDQESTSRYGTVKLLCRCNGLAYFRLQSSWEDSLWLCASWVPWNHDYVTLITDSVHRSHRH